MGRVRLLSVGLLRVGLLGALSVGQLGLYNCWLQAGGEDGQVHRCAVLAVSAVLAESAVLAICVQCLLLSGRKLSNAPRRT